MRLMLHDFTEEYNINWNCDSAHEQSYWAQGKYSVCIITSLPQVHVQKVCIQKKVPKYLHVLYTSCEITFPL